MHKLLKSKGRKPRTGIVKACELCGVEMYVRPSEITTRRYCSTACHVAAMQQTARVTCVVCGAAFNRSQSIGGKYCSRTCYLADRQPRKACKTCGAALSKSGLTYCSQACMFRDRQKRIVLVCEVCHNEYAIRASSAATSRYCSRGCKNQGIRLSGPGHTRQTAEGYIQVYYPAHPDASKGGYVQQHRLVVEQTIGRRLLPTEHVHHINGIRDDNRPENLQVIDARDHARVSIAQGVQKRKNMQAQLDEYKRRFGELE